MIYHICSKADLEPAIRSGKYEADSLETEGFIHCSTLGQIVATANLFFKGQRDLVILALDPARLEADLKVERASNGGDYPHIYGPINMDAMTRFHNFPVKPDGTFDLPQL